MKNLLVINEIHRYFELYPDYEMVTEGDKIQICKPLCKKLLEILSKYFDDDFVDSIIDNIITDTGEIRDCICFDILTKEFVFALKYEDLFKHKTFKRTESKYYSDGHLVIWDKSFLNEDFFKKECEIFDTKDSIFYEGYDKICKYENNIIWAKFDEYYTVNIEYFPTLSDRAGQILLFLTFN